jgi:hypothetical protein
MTRQLKRDLILNILFFIALLIIALFAIKLDTETCGREMLIWLILYTVFYFLKVIHYVYSLFSVIKNHHKPALILAYTRFFILNPFNIAWIIYGNVGFYKMSIDTDCSEENIDYTRLSTFTLIILIIGYIQMLYFLCSFCFFMA